MSGRLGTPWVTGWTVEDPLEIGAARVDADWGHWEPGVAPFLEYRDLDLERASAGGMGCRHVRTAGNGAGAEPWQANDVDFQYLYVLAGTAELAVAGAERATLGKGSAVVIPALLRHALVALSDDFEAVEIVAPARYDTVWGEHSALPGRAATLDPARALVVTHDSPDQYLGGAGPRAFFEYRDTGTRAATDERIHIHVVHATGTPVGDGTGWHYHSMAQWFMVLDGAADIRIEDGPRKHLNERDCMCIGAGEAMRHNVDRVSGDYKVLEMCVPAEYDTVAVAAPANAAD